MTHIDLAQRKAGWRLDPDPERPRLHRQRGPVDRGWLSGWRRPRGGRVCDGQHRSGSGFCGPMRGRGGQSRAHPDHQLHQRGPAKAQTGADLSAAPAFDLRAGFDSGPSAWRDLLALYPFDNTLRAVRITGGQLKDYLEQSARYYSDRPARPDLDQRQVAGLQLRHGCRGALRHRSPPPVGTDPEPRRCRAGRCRPTDSFTLAVNSYRQAGGGGYGMLRGAPVVYDRERTSATSW